MHTPDFITRYTSKVFVCGVGVQIMNHNRGSLLSALEQLRVRAAANTRQYGAGAPVRCAAIALCYLVPSNICSSGALLLCYLVSSNIC